MEALTGSCGVFVGCMANAFYLEYLVKGDPGCGNLVTFSQFLFIAAVGFVITSKFGTAERRIPLKAYMGVVALFFVCNVCNNLAFNFKISMPLQMIFRSGSLITNMAMTIFILKRKYSLEKYLSVGLITLGVTICTLESGKEMKNESDGVGANGNFFQWLIGIGLLIFGLIVSALLGVYQEQLFKNHGKHPCEALYYTHVLSLPIFSFFATDIWHHATIALNSEKISAPLIGLKMPSWIYYLMGNVATQYLCISSVYYLTTVASTLTVTLVITLRKFLSLLISVIYFQNPFTLSHWLGTILVFVGTLIYTEIPQKLKLCLITENLKFYSKLTSLPLFKV